MILSIRGAYIQGKKFVKLLAKKKSFERKDFRSETLLRKTEFIYALDRMELFSWSKHIDVDSELQWLKVNRDPRSHGVTRKGSGTEQSRRSTYPPDLYLHETEEFFIPALCEKIMEQCEYFCESKSSFQQSYSAYAFRFRFQTGTFNVSQRFHRPPVDLTKEELDEAIDKNEVISLKTDETMDHVKIMVDELSFLLDSYQFSTTLNVIRTVLLAPPQHRRERYYGNPSKAEEKKQHLGHGTEGIRKEMLGILKRHGNPASLDKKQCKSLLQSKAREILDDLEETQEKHHRRRTRRIEYTLCKAKWKVINIDSTDNSELNLTWFRGTHDFTVDGSVNSQIFLEDLQITTQRPENTAKIDYDPTIILKTEVGVERSSCQECGQPFDRRLNESSSCIFHSGIFTSSPTVRGWSCCQAKDSEDPGCVSRPHTGIENFLSIRVDCHPKTVEGMTFYSHIEANVYPGFPHTIIAQVTKTAVDFFRGYFIGGNDNYEIGGSKGVEMSNRNSEAIGGGISELASLNDLASVSSNNSTLNSSTPNTDEASSGTKLFKRDSDTSYITELPTLLALSSSRTLSGMERSTSTVTTNTLSTEMSRAANCTETSQYLLTNNNSETDDKMDTYNKRNLLFGKVHNSKAEKSSVAKKSRQSNDEKSSSKRRKKSGDQVEIFFVKHLRVGEINLQASLTEFLISVNKANFTSISYEQAYQIGDWSHLINQYLRERFQTLAPQALNELFMKRKMILGKTNEHSNENQEGRRDKKDGMTPPVTPEHVLFGAPKEKKKRRGAFGRRKGD